MIRRQHGAALLLALWVTVLLAALLVGVAAASRSHSQAALYGSEHARARLAAEAGLAQAVARLRAPNAASRCVPDGRPYTFAFDAARVTVRVVDVSGLLDLNAASPRLFDAVLRAEGVGAARAAAIAGALMAARAPAGDRGLAGADPVGAGSMSRPDARGRFRAIDELARVPGMDVALFQRIAPDVTVYSGRNFPDTAYASAAVVAAMRGVPLATARSLVAARRARPAVHGTGDGLAADEVAGGPLVAGPGGVVARVISVAELPDGSRSGIDATIRLALTGPGARPYKVLDWRIASAAAP